jgi:hypothetical protein
VGPPPPGPARRQLRQRHRPVIKQKDARDRARCSSAVLWVLEGCAMLARFHAHRPPLSNRTLHTFKHLTTRGRVTSWETKNKQTNLPGSCYSHRCSLYEPNLAIVKSRVKLRGLNLPSSSSVPRLLSRLSGPQRAKAVPGARCKARLRGAHGPHSGGILARARSLSLSRARSCARAHFPPPASSGCWPVRLHSRSLFWPSPCALLCSSCGGVRRCYDPRHAATPLWTIQAAAAGQAVSAVNSPHAHP